MFPEIRLTINSITESIDIEKIVTRISVEDIERYILRKYQGRGFLATYETQQRIACEIRMVEDHLKSQGYEIYRVHYIEPTEFSNLRKENEKLRHEVSVLAKKLNKMKGD